MTTAARGRSYCGLPDVDLHALGESAKHAHFGGALFYDLMARFDSVLSASCLPHGAQGPAVACWLRITEQIGQQSRHGATYAGVIGDVADAIVIKTGDDRAALTDEYSVQRILNLLRPVVPNFALAFGKFDCGATDYLIVERVVFQRKAFGTTTSMTLNQYLTRAPPTILVLLSVLTQIMLALQLAQDIYRFTHYDLHPGNILMEGLDDISPAPQSGYVQLHYPTKAEWTPIRTLDLHGYVSVRAPVVPVVVDFGYSRLTDIEGRNHGGMYPDDAAGITQYFSAAYDPILVVASVERLLRLTHGDKRLSPLRAVCGGRVKHWSSLDRWARIGLQPDGRPDTAGGLTPLGIVEVMQSMYPKQMAQIVNRFEPGDVVAKEVVPKEVVVPRVEVPIAPMPPRAKRRRTLPTPSPTPPPPSPPSASERPPSASERPPSPLLPLLPEPSWVGESEAEHARAFDFLEQFAAED